MEAFTPEQLCVRPGQRRQLSEWALALVRRVHLRAVTVPAKFPLAVARRLGYVTCWIERRKGKQGTGATPKVQNVAIPDYHFSSLAELADAVDQGK